MLREGAGETAVLDDSLSLKRNWLICGHHSVSGDCLEEEEGLTQKRQVGALGDNEHALLIDPGGDYMHTYIRRNSSSNILKVSAYDCANHI